MTRSLKGKMILSYLAVALLTVLVVSVLIRLTSGRSLMSLVVEEQTASLSQTVQEYYTANGSLGGFTAYYREIDHKGPPPQGEKDYPPPQTREFRGLHGLVDANYRALFPTLGYAIGETVPQSSIKDAIAVEVDGETVAWILPDTSLQFKLSPEEELFLQRTTLAIGVAALTGVALAVLMGFLLAGRLLNPIRLLTQASQALAQGNLNQQVPVTSTDELGLLTATFNQMSADLSDADQQRKRMTADITHDLSTPIQIISGYVEMLEAEEVTLTPQRIGIIKTELEHLGRLVGDLNTLTQAEAGALDIQLEALEPGVLLERVYNAFQPIAAHRRVELRLNLPASLPSITVDEGRMVQVLKNLLENALRYTSSGGVIELGADLENNKVVLRVKDNGAGIDAEDLPYVFDRFYRADPARTGNTGKMGLGLAICKALVTAQGGSISAESAGKDQGASMVIAFDPV